MNGKFIALFTAFALGCCAYAMAEDVPLDTYTEGYRQRVYSEYGPEPIVSSTNRDDSITSVDTGGSTGAMTGNGMGVGGKSYGVELGGNNYGAGPGYGNSLRISGAAGGTSGGGAGGTGGTAGGAGGGR